VTGPALETRALVRRFGGLTATDNVSLKLAPGARHALIGPNGAGKTTLVNLLTGIVKPTSGQVLLEGVDVTALPAHTRVRRGLSRTFQINQLFAEMTPAEHLCLAVGERLGKGRSWLGVAGADSAIVGEVEDLLRRFGLLDIMDLPIRQLAYGRQRLLEIALALACRPRVLLLDEPAAGVPEGVRGDILAALDVLPIEVTILMIEHDMDMVFRFARSISVLVAGALLMEGSPAEVAADSRVREVYLGAEAHG
jgi:ABC-type branched-subunit amino acid transport system ATPase component